MTGPFLSVQPRPALFCLLAVCIALGGTGCATASRATTSALPAPEPIAETASAPQPEAESAPAPVAKAARPKKRAAPRATEVKTEAKVETKSEPRTPVAARTTELKRPQPEMPGAGEPVAFEPSAMTRPQRVSGREPQLTAEARAERVRGTALVRCVVTREGRVTNCRLLNGLPYMEQELLEALSTWRVTPVTAQGKPLDVDYTFVVRIPTG
ncbi:protein TonB [Archangium gephyra]|uniref:Protein TonB n=1 Tax=Archangium gephyra TaxID=48 RepID=A0AAC8TKI3_9BACT|nr:energy transducer TonB [Archangium gephyra]AKJ08236.1 Ferric siderophore transport system, periplasmic binding protein TonB [Archangium gephyra]REG15349.1 protein TonB [Archangium gephyra]